MSSDNKALPECDCLNDCGDDPAVKNGKAAACDKLKERRERDQQRALEFVRVNLIMQQYGVTTVYDLVEHLHTKVEQLSTNTHPAPKQAQGPVEAILVEGSEYSVPSPVAAEILRLHLQSRGAIQERDAIYDFMESKRQYVEGLRSALVYHMEQTRPIQRSIDALAAAPKQAESTNG